MHYRGKKITAIRDIAQDGYFSEFGKWYLPNKEDNAVGGTITYDNGLIKLETMYTLDSGKSQNIIEQLRDNRDNLKKYSTIYGILSTDETIILQDCTLVGHNNNKFRYNVDRMYATNMLVDCRIDFDTIMIEYDNLFEWRLPPSIETEHDENGGWTLTYKKATPINIQLSDNQNLSIYQTYSISHSAIEKNFEIPQGMIVSIKSEVSNDYKNAKKTIEVFRRLLMLCINNVSYPISIHTGIEKNLINVLEDHEKYINKPYVYLYDIHPNYLQLQDDFENIIKKWYNVHQRLNNTMTSYFTYLLFEREQTLESSFLGICFIIESLQREKFPQRIQPIPGISRTKQRLDLILNPFKDHFQHMDTEKISNTRDYYAHGFIEEKKDTIIPNSLEMVYSIKWLNALIQFHFFDDILDDKNLLNEIMEKRLKRIKQEEELNRQS